MQEGIIECLLLGAANLLPGDLRQFEKLPGNQPRDEILTKGRVQELIRGQLCVVQLDLCIVDEEEPAKRDLSGSQRGAEASRRSLPARWPEQHGKVCVELSLAYPVPPPGEHRQGNDGKPKQLMVHPLIDFCRREAGLGLIDLALGERDKQPFIEIGLVKDGDGMVIRPLRVATVARTPQPTLVGVVKGEHDQQQRLGG